MTPKPKDDLEWDDLCQEDQDFIKAITKFAESSEIDANEIIARIESIRETQRQQTAQEYKKKVIDAIDNTYFSDRDWKTRLKKELKL